MRTFNGISPLPSPWLVFLCTVCIALGSSPAGARNPGWVEGKVVDETGKPVEDVTIEVTRPDDPEFRLTETTDGKGRFSIKLEQPKASYLYKLTKDGFDPSIVTLDAKPGAKASYEVVFARSDSEAVLERRAIEAYNAGADAFNQGDLDSALARMEEAAELNPALLDAQLALAEILLAKEDHGGAVGAAERALELAPHDAKAHSIRLEAALKMDDEERLAEIVTATQGTEAAANSAVLLFNDGVYANQQGDPATMVRRFEQAVSLDPKLAPAYSALAVAAYNSGNYEKAHDYAARLVDLEPSNAQGLRVRYLALTAQGDAAAAAAALEAFRTGAPEAAKEELYDRAEELFKADRLDEAQGLLESLLEQHPEMVEAHYTLGLVKLNGGDKAAAKEHLQKVLDLAPDSPKAEEARSMLAYL